MLSVLRLFWGFSLNAMERLYLVFSPRKSTLPPNLANLTWHLVMRKLNSIVSHMQTETDPFEHLLTRHFEFQSYYLNPSCLCHCSQRGCLLFLFVCAVTGYPFAFRLNDWSLSRYPERRLQMMGRSGLTKSSFTNSYSMGDSDDGTVLFFHISNTRCWSCCEEAPGMFSLVTTTHSGSTDKEASYIRSKSWMTTLLPEMWLSFL